MLMVRKHSSGIGLENLCVDILNKAAPAVLICLTFVSRLRQDPADLEALGDAIKLHEQLQGERDTIEGMISPIQDQFAILEKNEVAIPEEVSSGRVYIHQRLFYPENSHSFRFNSLTFLYSQANDCGFCD